MGTLNLILKGLPMFKDIIVEEIIAHGSIIDGRIVTGEEGFYRRGGIVLHVETMKGYKVDIQIEKLDDGTKVFFEPTWNIQSTSLLEVVEKSEEFDFNYNSEENLSSESETLNSLESYHRTINFKMNLE